MDIKNICDNLLYTVYPELNSLQSSKLFSNNVSIRNDSEVIEACDLYYCLHWMLREHGTNSDKAYVVIERRRVLEWVLGEEEWDDVSLDT